MSLVLNSQFFWLHLGFNHAFNCLKVVYSQMAILFDLKVHFISIKQRVCEYILQYASGLQDIAAEISHREMSW